MIFESWCIGICLMFWWGRYCYGNKDIISCSLGKPVELNVTFLKIRAYIIGCRNQKALFTWGGCCSMFVAEPWQRLPSVLAPSTPGTTCVAGLPRRPLGSIPGVQPGQHSFGDGGTRGVCCHSWQVLGTQKMVLMQRSHCRMDQSLQLKRNSFIEIQLMYHKIHPFFVFLQSLCSHYQCVISEYFHHPLGVPPISPFPISWQPQICFLFVDLSLEHFNQVESCSTHLLVTGFISLNMAFSVFIHVVACVITYCVLPPNNIPLCGYATFYLFTSCWTFGLFLLCCCWGKAAMNRCMQISFLYYTNNLFKENYLKINWGLCVCFGHS